MYNEIMKDGGPREEKTVLEEYAAKIQRAIQRRTQVKKIVQLYGWAPDTAAPLQRSVRKKTGAIATTTTTTDPTGRRTVGGAGGTFSDTAIITNGADGDQNTSRVPNMFFFPYSSDSTHQKIIFQ